MEPPLRVPSIRQAAAPQRSTSTTSISAPAANVPIPDIMSDLTQEPKSSKRGFEWNGSDTRLHIEVAECIETKTVTTTTTTKRQYPPLVVRPPRSLRDLNSKDYPLASQPTPQELTNFSYMVGDSLVRFREQDPSTPRSTHKGHDNGPLATPSLTRTSTGIQRVEDVTEDAFNLKKQTRAASQGSSNPFEGRIRPRTSSQSQQRRGSLSSFRQHMKHEVSDSLSTPNGTVLSRTRLDDFDSGRNDSSTDLSTASIITKSKYRIPENGSSASESTANLSFSGAVATPPITDAELEPFEHLTPGLTETNIAQPSTSTDGIQSASLPSPSLSPTLAAANLHSGRFMGSDEDDIEDGAFPFLSIDNQERYSANAGRWGSSGELDVSSRVSETPLEHLEVVTVKDTHVMLETFDAMSDEMKTFMIYQFLRRCPRKTLHTVARVVNPALKCDFLEQLPPELSLHILGFLDYKDLCRAAQVSKRWRDITDSNETGWKELLDKDNYVLPAGELEKAIIQGWGWQDPYGVDGWERDLSSRSQTSDGNLDVCSSTGRAFFEASSTLSRSSMKRKRALGSLGIDRSKRQALSLEVSERFRNARTRNTSTSANKFRKSDGPNAAATAAALAVPNPELGLPSLSKLHLFKSLYRRHHMLEQNWMSGKIQPHHMAFPAHPRHVITCLQFDDDKILTGSDDTYIHVYDTKTGKLRKRLEGHEGGVWALQYEGNILVSGSTDRSVRVWDIEKGLCTQVFQGHTSTVRCLQILMPINTGKAIKGKAVMVPEKPLIITGSRDSQLRVWRLPEQGGKRFMQIAGSPDTDCPYFIRVLQGHSHSVRAIAAYEDTLVSGSYDHTVRVWKISTGETVHQLRGHDQKVYSVVLDNARRRCISGSMDNTVKIWSLGTGTCLHTLNGHTSLVGLLDLKDDRLVSAAADATLRIWDPETGGCKATLSAHTGAITCFQHDGIKVVSGSDRTLKMWNVKTGECLQDLLTDLSGVWQVKFDERRCVAAVQRDGLTYIEVRAAVIHHLVYQLTAKRSSISEHLEMVFPLPSVADAFCSRLRKLTELPMMMNLLHKYMIIRFNERYILMGN